MQKKFLNAYIDLINKLDTLGKEIVEEEVGGLVQKEADNLNAAAGIIRENLALNGIKLDENNNVSFTEARISPNQTGSEITAGRSDRQKKEEKPAAKKQDSPLKVVRTAEKQSVVEKTEEKAPEEKQMQEAPETAGIPEEELPIKKIPEVNSDNIPEENNDVSSDDNEPEQYDYFTDSPEESSEKVDRFAQEVHMNPDEDPLANMFEEVNTVLDQAVRTHGRAEKQPEMPMVQHSEPNDPEKNEDIPSINENDMALYFVAFSVMKHGKSLGDYELITVPVDPKNPGGRFFYYIQNYNTENSMVGVSDLSNGRGKLNYTPEGQKFYVDITAERDGSRHRVSIYLPKKYGEIEIAEETQFGDLGHVLLHDQGTTLHLFPIEFNNTEANGTTSCVCMIEKDGVFDAVQTKNGVMDVETNGTKMKLSAAWSEDYTLYSKIA